MEGLKARVKRVDNLKTASRGEVPSVEPDAWELSEFLCLRRLVDLSTVPSAPSLGRMVRWSSRASCVTLSAS